MAVREEIRVGDEVPLQVNFIEDGVIFDISTATVREIWVQKPDGTPLKFTAAFLTDGFDGSLVYNMLTAETTPEGQWKYQGHVESPAWKLTTKMAEFYIGAVIDVSAL